MSGGLWGARRGALPQIMQLIDAFPANSNYLTDMEFLNAQVWPLARADVLQHDAFSCDVFEGAQPFPVALDPQGNHVGQVFAADGTARAVDVEILRAAKQPPSCTPGSTLASALTALIAASAASA